MSDVLTELARVKVLFQQRAILIHMGVDPDMIRHLTQPTGGGTLSVPAAGHDAMLSHGSVMTGPQSHRQSSDDALGGHSDCQKFIPHRSEA